MGTCGVYSPDGSVSCMKRAGHESLECCNPSTGLKWCGACMKWTCPHIEKLPLDAAPVALED